MNTYIYDGSFEGLISVVFHAFKTKVHPTDIVRKGTGQLSLVGSNFEIKTDTSITDRVLEGIIKKGSQLSIQRIFKSFLSEVEGIELTIFEYIKLIVLSKENQEENYTNLHVLKLKQLTKQVDREVHRMHAFVRFQKSSNDIFTSAIEPDFNVIPLIGEHFEKRYRDQKWLIFDVKRRYGIFYDLTGISEVVMDSKGMHSVELDNLLQEEELNYQSLWKSYFQSVNITERKNMKLHVQHVPKRYWKYLTEKS